MLCSPAFKHPGFRRQGWFVVMPEIRGWGQSLLDDGDTAHWRPELLAADLLCVLDALEVRAPTPREAVVTDPHIRGEELYEAALYFLRGY